MKEETSEKHQKKSVLVALSGRVDSFVAAYLLKQQDFDVSGMAFQYFDVDDEAYFKKRKHSGMEGQSINVDDDDPYISKLKPHCHIDQLDEMKSLSDQLNIKFFASKAYAMYREEVLGHLYSSRLQGRAFYPCVSCAKLTIKLLLEKANSLGIDYIATGHYAKVYFNQNEKIHFLMSANDQAHDQSFLLASLGQTELSRMILPLGDLRKSEVEKIAQKNNWPTPVTSSVSRPCFVKNREINNLIERTTAPSLRKSGIVYRYSDDYNLGVHNGIHLYAVGDYFESQKSLGFNSGKYVVVKILASKGSVIVAPEKECRHSKVFLERVVLKSNLDLSRPIKAIVKFGDETTALACDIEVKNNNHVLITLDKERIGILAQGRMGTIYDVQQDGKLLVLAQGEVKFIERFYAFSNKEEKNDFEDEIKGEKNSKKNDLEIKF